MLQVTGQLVNVFNVPAGVGKDGKEFAERSKIQIMGNVALANGESKLDLMDLSIDDFKLWEGYKGKVVTADIGAFPSNGVITYFVLKGSKPRLMSQAVA